MFALVISDGDFDLPQHLLADFADRRAESGDGSWGVEIKDTQKILMLKVFVGFQSAAAHQGISDADGCRALELCLDVEIIILFQIRILNVVEYILPVGLPVFVSQLRGDPFEPVPESSIVHIVIPLQHGGNAVRVFITVFPQPYSTGVLTGAGISHIKDIPQTRIISGSVD
jgi:hypothetical protein